MTQKEALKVSTLLGAVQLAIAGMEWYIRDFQVSRSNLKGVVNNLKQAVIAFNKGKK